MFLCHYCREHCLSEKGKSRGTWHGVCELCGYELPCENVKDFKLKTKEKGKWENILDDE